MSLVTYENVKEALLNGMGEETYLVDAQAEKFTECHMGAMNHYSIELQKVSYDVIMDGGSFADSKAAFDTAFAAGGKKLEDLQAMHISAEAFAQSCLGMR